MRLRHILRYGSATVALTALTLFAGWWQVDGPATPSSPGPFPLPLAEMTFKLVDHEGQSVGPQSLVGRPTMVFFGFTYCPDVCPTTLSDITSWLDALGEVAAQLNVIFITVDPARDTVEVLSQYIKYFHAQIRGWTGSAAEISRAARDFRVSARSRPPFRFKATAALARPRPTAIPSGRPFRVWGPPVIPGRPPFLV